MSFYCENPCGCVSHAQFICAGLCEIMKVRCAGHRDESEEELFAKLNYDTEEYNKFLFDNGWKDSDTDNNK